MNKIRLPFYTLPSIEADMRVTHTDFSVIQTCHIFGYWRCTLPIVCMCAHMHIYVCLCTCVCRGNCMFERRGPKLMLVVFLIACYLSFFWDRVSHWTNETLWSRVFKTCPLPLWCRSSRCCYPHLAASLWGCWSSTLGSLSLCRKIWAISPVDNVKFDTHLQGR